MEMLEYNAINEIIIFLGFYVIHSIYFRIKMTYGCMPNAETSETFTNCFLNLYTL